MRRCCACGLGCSSVLSLAPVSPKHFPYPLNNAMDVRSHLGNQIRHTTADSVSNRNPPRGDSGTYQRRIAECDQELEAPLRLRMSHPAVMASAKR